MGRLAGVLAPEVRDAQLPDMVRTLVERASSLIDSAARTSDGSPVPTELTKLSKSLFADDPSARLATRALLFLRGLGDDYTKWFPKSDPPEVNSFRVHLFFRSIEGLFGPPLIPTEGGGRQRPVGTLTVEKGLRFGGQGDGITRLLELVYCECCGELFFAGMKGMRKGGGSTIELLPIDPRLDGLPESAASQLFEELTAEQFGIFWPRSDMSPYPSNADARVSAWTKACLDPVTGVLTVATAQSDPWQNPDRLKGYYYLRDLTAQDSHGRRGKNSLFVNWSPSGIGPFTRSIRIELVELKNAEQGLMHSWPTHDVVCCK